MKNAILDKIYTLQSYLEKSIVDEKRENKDYKITYTLIMDDDAEVAILVDGNHSLAAAKLDGVEPIIEFVKNESEKNLVHFVIAFDDLSNPVNIVTGEELWQ